MVDELFPSRWSWVKLKDIQAPNTRAIVSGPFGSNIGSRFFVSNGVPVIRGNNLTTNMTRFIDNGFVFVTEEKAMELAGCEALPGDLVFTAAGSLGQVGLIPSVAKYSKYIISNKQMRARLNREVVDELFAFYWFSSPWMVKYIEQRNTGSSVPLINLSILRDLPIPLPSLTEQRAIAHILGTLDDKIELNRQLNKTLEAIAQALFKSWFVDFDPVRARMEGRQPYGMDAETAALFPDSFEDSGLGEIPRGWKVGRLDDLLVLQRGYDLPSHQRIPGPFPIISASGPSGAHIDYKVCGPGVTTGRSGLLGKVFFVHENFWPLNTSLYVKEYRISRPIHAYHVLTSLDFEIFNAGSAVPTLNRNHVHNLPVIVPLLILIEAFENRAMPLFRLCYQNEQQTLTLVAIRDILLPKLLSGEIRVKDAEIFVEASA